MPRHDQSCLFFLRFGRPEQALINREWSMPSILSSADKKQNLHNVYGALDVAFRTGFFGAGRWRLCRHRSHGERVADDKVAVYPHGGSLCAVPIAGGL